MVDDAVRPGANRPVRLAESARVDAGEARRAQEFADAVMALLTAARRTRGRLQPLFDDVTVPQLVLLDAIDGCGQDGTVAVAAQTGLSQPTVTRGVTALEQAGLVRREPTGDDARRRVIRLTSKGRGLLRDKQAVVAERFAAAWDQLDPDERDLAVPLLRRLADLVGDLL